MGNAWIEFINKHKTEKKYLRANGRLDLKALSKAYKSGSKSKTKRSVEKTIKTKKSRTLTAKEKKDRKIHRLARKSLTKREVDAERLFAECDLIADMFGIGRSKVDIKFKKGGIVSIKIGSLFKAKRRGFKNAVDAIDKQVKKLLSG